MAKSKYKKEYCDMLVEHMKEGLSFESFGGIVGVWKEALYNWVKKHSEFSDAKKLGLSYSLLYWERIGNDAANGKIFNFNATAYVFNMKNRFAWRDKKDIDANINGEVKTTINVTFE